MVYTNLPISQFDDNLYYTRKETDKLTDVKIAYLKSNKVNMFLYRNYFRDMSMSSAHSP